MSGIPAGAGQLLGKRLGKFEIVALLALGGTAEIYLARIGGAAGFEKYVVVKCLHDHLADDAEFVKMFLDEARLAAHLDHSNIVQTMELGEHAGRYYMVMEFLAGLSLAMIIRRATERLPGGKIPVPLVLNILAQSCAGLHYAHEKAMNGRALNIVHRDISPQNLVISFEGVVKLVDFGIAKAEMRETRTRSGTIKGKFAYMSPEQCVANNVDRRTDVFALGVIGHELLTGRRLFKRPSPYETYQAVIECDVRPPSLVDPHIEPALDAVIMRAITKDKTSRYPTAEAFGDALLGYLHHRGIGSGPGDVSRFFDAQFAQEIEEHSARMRELIAGRDLSVDTSVSWGDEGDESRRDSEPPGAIGAMGTPGASSGASAGAQRMAAPRSFVLDDLGSRGAADDEMPAERTRIESNPMEQINELERIASGRISSGASGRTPPSHEDAPTLLAPSSAVPVPPPPPGEVGASPPARRAALAASPPAANPFSDAASQPTLVAVEPLASPPVPAVPAPLPGSGRTAAAGAAPLAGSPRPLPGLASPPRAVPSLGGAPRSVALGGSPLATPPRALPSLGGPPLGGPSAPGPGAPRDSVLGRSSQPAGAHAPPPRMPSGSAPPLSTPPSHGTSPGALRPLTGNAAQGSSPTTLDAAMAAAPGASAAGQPASPGAGQPASPGAGQPANSSSNQPANSSSNQPASSLSSQPTRLELGQPASPGSGPPLGHAPVLPQGYPVMNAELSAQIATGATVFPSDPMRGASHGGAPSRAAEASGAFDGQLLPAGELVAQAIPPGSGVEGGAGGPLRAAGVMSPVGQRFAENVDWTALATHRLRVVPPWLLAVLFVGAIGVALALTIVISRLAR